MSNRKFFIAVDYDGLCDNESVTLRLEPALTNFVTQHGKPYRRTAYTALGPGWSIQKYMLLELKRRGWNICHLLPVSRGWLSNKKRTKAQEHPTVHTQLTMDVWEAALKDSITDVVLLTHNPQFLPLIEGLRARNINVLLLGSYPKTHSALIIASRLFLRFGDIPGLVPSKRPTTDITHNSGHRATSELSSGQEDGTNGGFTNKLLDSRDMNDEVV